MIYCNYYILYGVNEDGNIERIFGDYDLEAVEYEKEITSSLDFTKMKIKTLPSDSQASIDAWWKIEDYKHNGYTVA